MKQCTCGGNPMLISEIFGVYAKCDKCGKEAEKKDTYTEAEAAWDDLNGSKPAPAPAPKAAPEAETPAKKPAKKRATKKEVE